MIMMELIQETLDFELKMSFKFLRVADANLKVVAFLFDDDFSHSASSSERFNFIAPQHSLFNERREIKWGNLGGNEFFFLSSWQV